MCMREKKIKFSGEGWGVKTIGIRNIKKQEQGVPVNQPSQFEHMPGLPWQVESSK